MPFVIYAKVRSVPLLWARRVRRLAIKVTYHDQGHGRWALVYARSSGSQGRRSIQCRDTGKVLTATFGLTDACFDARDDDFDFHIEAEGEDAIVSFIRVIKTPRLHP